MTIREKIPPIEGEGVPVSELDAGFVAQDNSQYRLVDFLKMLRVRRFVILGTMLVVTALAAVAVYARTPLYTGSATVMLDERKNNMTDLTAVLSGLSTTDPSTMDNQVQILTSRKLAGRVVDKLKLDQDPEFNGDEDSGKIIYWFNPKHWLDLLPANVLPSSGSADTGEEEDPRDAVIDSVLDQLSVDTIGTSTALNVNFDSEDPAKAARIANAFADEYVEDALDAKYEAAQKTGQWLGSRLKDLQEKMQAADAAVTAYRIAHNLTVVTVPGNGTDPVPIGDQTLSGINAQLVTAKADLADKEAQYERVVQLAHSGHAADVSAVVQSPLIATLRGQEADLLRQEADMASRYGPRHPKMIDLQSQKENLQSKINEEVQRVVETVHSDVIVARAHVQSLEDSLNQLSGRSQSQSAALGKLQELQGAATAARTLYQTVLTNFNDAQSQSGVQTPDSRILSRAAVPTDPSSPKKKRDIGIGLLAGLLLGVALAFAIEQLDVGFRTPAQVEAKFGLPVLASVPEIGSSGHPGANPADAIIDYPTSAFAEAVRGVELGLKLAEGEAPPRVVLISSAVPGEGKTTLAVALARLVAAGGRRVLLIDADLRKPAIASMMGLPRPERGLVDALAHVGDLEKCIQKDPRSNALVLPCAGKASKDAPDLLASNAMKALVERARKTFDLVIIDSAPLLPVHDSWVLAPRVDAVLLTVRWEKTPREAVAGAVRIGRDANAPIAGIVLTRANPELFQYYSYGYQDYGAYNKYYGT